MTHRCECTIPPGKRVGWCPHHKVYKTANWIRLCKTRPGYRKAWDEGRGPGQNLPKGDPISLVTGKKVKRETGPGHRLRRILGCTAKKWPYYAKMDALGNKCIDHIDELSKSLVDLGYLETEKQSRRFIKMALMQSYGADK